MVAPHSAKPTVRLVDDYCEMYSDLFPEIRSFEAFKQLHVGMISEAKRESLPAIANVQSLQQFLVTSPWNVKQVRGR